MHGVHFMSSWTFLFPLLHPSTPAPALTASTNLGVMTALVWLVTGATSGLGKALVSSIVSKGDKVVATGRNAEQRLADLKSSNVAVVDLDVSASREIIDGQVAKAWAAFGQIDVLVNNAGFSAPKSIEEARYKISVQYFPIRVG